MPPNINQRLPLLLKLFIFDQKRPKMMIIHRNKKIDFSILSFTLSHHSGRKFFSEFQQQTTEVI